MRWKPELAHADPAVLEDPEEDLALRDRLSADLQNRGLPMPVADLLIARLLPDLEGRTESEVDAILEGVALGLRAESEIADELSRSAGELQEIERLMGSFAGELSKLDEVLEVLAAYLQRMRVSAPDPGARTLH